ncbi:MAG: helix-turn-helix domain-containing protein [Thermoanaerobaculia bacterium]
MNRLTPKEIRTRRLALGLSADELARRLNLSPGLLEQWERGDAPIEEPDRLFAELLLLEQGDQPQS